MTSPSTSSTDAAASGTNECARFVENRYLDDVRWYAAVVALLVAAYACSEYGADPGETAPDASTDAPTSTEDAAPTPDAAFDVDGGLPTKCTASGEIVSAVRAFVLLPDGGHPACSPNAVLVEDGIPAGLDRSDGTSPTIDGQAVGGCVAVELDPTVSVAKIIVRTKAVGNACGIACQPIEGGCGTGRGVYVFAGDSEATLKSVGPDLSTPDDWVTHEIDAPAAAPVRFIATCRQTASSARDDVAVDFIGVRCR
jgi:hypothetical protein